MVEPARRLPPPAPLALAATVLQAIDEAGAGGITRGDLRTRFPLESPTRIREALRRLLASGSIVHRLERRPDRKGAVQEQLTYFRLGVLAEVPAPD